MKRILVILFVVICPAAFAQSFKLVLNDNGGVQRQLKTYTLSDDSLIITARSDYGRSVVDYLKRALTADESKSLKKFMKSFPADSLKETYFNDYSNLGYIDAENFPREIEIVISKNEKSFTSKATNAYVYFYARLIEEINPVLPSEVKISYIKDQFNAFY